jgi:hypothetical protein
MYKSDFKSKRFLIGLEVIEERLDWEEYGEELIRYPKEKWDTPLDELINEFTCLEGYLRTTTEKIDPADLGRIRILSQIILLKLGINYDIEYLLDVLEEQFSLIQKGFERLHNYENHRHKTIAGLYTEKASY